MRPTPAFSLAHLTPHQHKRAWEKSHGPAPASLRPPVLNPSEGGPRPKRENTHAHILSTALPPLPFPSRTSPSSTTHRPTCLLRPLPAFPLSPLLLPPPPPPLSPPPPPSCLLTPTPSCLWEVFVWGFGGVVLVVSVGVGGVVLCRCVCVCDLLLFLHSPQPHTGRHTCAHEHWLPRTSACEYLSHPLPLFASPR